MADITLSSFTYASIGGITPSLIWLFFWLKEDCHPEPKKLLIYAFFSGILSIPLALLLEQGIQDYFNSVIMFSPSITTTALFTGLAFAEELSKYILVSVIIFWRKDFDEPVDAMVYLMTAALGFAAIENILYLTPQFAENFRLGLTVGNLRFVGATLLHALSSGILGFFIAHQFCNGRLRRFIGVVWGLFFATILHTVFNLLMLNTDANDLSIVLLFLALFGIFIIFAYEHIKKVHHTCNTHKYTHLH